MQSATAGTQTIYSRYARLVVVTVLCAVVTASALAQGQDLPAHGQGDGLPDTRVTNSAGTALTAATLEENAHPPRQLSLDEMAIELMNPVGSLRALTSEYFYQSHQGDMPNADDQAHQSVAFTPVFPFARSNGRRIVLRATVPLYLAQPTYVYMGNRRDFTEWRIRQEASSIRRSGDFYYVHDHMYDINFDVAYGGVNDQGVIGMAGIAGALPTSNDLSGARRQYLLGPQFAVGKMFKRGIAGAWVSHLTDVADDSSSPFQIHNTNLTDLKLFFAYGIGNGWQIVSNSHITYDWEGEDDNKLLLPLGGGVARTTRIGSVPVRFVIEAQAYLETPEAFGPEWSLKFSMAAVDMKRSLF